MYHTGERIYNRYQVLSELGRGSYGIVYQVFDEHLGAKLALKSLIIDQNTTNSVKKMTETMFRNEYEASLRIKSPFVIRSYDYFEDKKIPSFTMEYASGKSLFSRMHEFVNDWDLFNKFAFHFYCGLGDIHRAGVVHRDIKAENILLDGGLHPKITDFGVAHLMKNELIDKLLGRYTKEVIGTEPYLAPEQRSEDTSKRETSPSTDIFAAGVMIYFLLTKGQHFPFGVFQKNQNGYSEYVARTFQSNWDHISTYRGDVPSFWLRIIEGSLQGESEKRISNADFIRDILQEHIGSKKIEVPNAPVDYAEWDDLGLKVVVGKNNGEVYQLKPWMTPLNNGLITIGRLDEQNPDRNMINIEDLSNVISRKQAVIEYNRSQKRWYLRNGQFDLSDGQQTWREPPNGTMIRGEEVDGSGVEIKLGDEIIFGNKYLLTVVKIKK